MWPLYDSATRYPRRLSDTSFDFKLMWVYQIAVVILLVLVHAAGRIVSVELEFSFVAILATGLTVLSIKHRRAARWRWSGAGPREAVAAVTCALLLGLFLFAATPGAPPSDPIYLPWYLGALGLGLFLILGNLRLVRMSQIDFEADCGDASAFDTSVATTVEPVWKRRLRAVFSALIVLVWLDGVAFFYVHGTSVRDGSTIPTATHSERIVEHGRVVYITQAQDQLRSILQTIIMAGIPLIIVSAIVLNNLIGVPIYPARRER